MKIYQIAIIAAVIILVGVLVLPVFNRWQFKRLPADQQVLAIMKQANKLVFWKNISNGRSGNLFYVKNKRKILVYPWVLNENGKMVITKKNPFDNWDYPEEKAPLDDAEIKQAREELYRFSEKSAVKIIFNDPFEQKKTEQKP